MKLQFEEWIDNVNISDPIKEIFYDSAICYKNGVSRAALLLSYVAFLNVLRERILLAEKPNTFEEGQWTDLQNRIVRDDSWERAIFDATQQLPKYDQSTKALIKDAVFSINDSLRKQIYYWKDRRNDCAHFKDNRIDDYYVNAFWSFLQSNLAKITVEGGKQSLLNKIRKHYNITYTPRNKDVTPLIHEIESSVRPLELNTFWEEVLSIIDRGYSFLPTQFLLDFILKVLVNSSDSVKNSLLAFLRQESDLLIAFLSKYPDKITLLNLAPPEVRNFWKTQLQYSSRPLDIYAAILNAGLIPNGEITEANQSILLFLKSYEASDYANFILSKNGFQNEFETKYFETSQFKFYNTTNDRSDLLISFLKLNRFTENIVKVLCFEFSKATNYSQWLHRKLKDLFEGDTSKKGDFKEIASTHVIVIPNLINEILQ